MKRVAAAVLALGLGVALGAPAPAPQLRDVWIRTAPPGASVQAGYFTLDNPTGRALRVVGVDVPDFERAELHATVTDGARTGMRLLPALDVAAGGTLAATPGGVHVMLFGAKRPLAAGERLPFTLRLADGSELHAEAELRDARAAEAHDHRH